MTRSRTASGPIPRLPHKRGELRLDWLAVAGGVFVAVALSLVITIGQQVLETAPHFVWQTFVVLGLEIKVVLLALAAVRAISGSILLRTPRGNGSRGLLAAVLDD